MLQLKDFFQDVLFEPQGFLLDTDYELVVFYYLGDVPIKGKDASCLLWFCYVIVVLHHFFHAFVQDFHFDVSTSTSNQVLLMRDFDFYFGLLQFLVHFWLRLLEAVYLICRRWAPNVVLRSRQLLKLLFQLLLSFLICSNIVVLLIICLTLRRFLLIILFSVLLEYIMLCPNLVKLFN